MATNSSYILLWYVQWSHHVFGDGAGAVSRELSCDAPSLLSRLCLSSYSRASSQDICAAPRERTECRGVSEKYIDIVRELDKEKTNIQTTSYTVTALPKRSSDDSSRRVHASWI